MAKASTRKQLGELWEFTQGRRLPIYVGAILSVMVSALTLLQPVLVSDLVETADRGDPPKATLVAQLIVIITAVVLLTAAKDYLLESSAERLVAHTRKRLVKAILSAPLQIIGRWRSGDIESRVTSDATTLRLAVTGGIADFAGAVLTIVGAVIALIIIDQVTFCIVLAAVVAAAVVTMLGARGLRRMTEEQQAWIGEVGSQLSSSLRAIKILKAYGLTSRAINDATEASRDAMKTGFRIARIRSVFIPLSELSFQTAFIVVVLTGAVRVASGSIDMADLAGFILFVSLLIGPVSVLMAVVASISEALGAYRRIQSTVVESEKTAAQGHAAEKTPISSEQAEAAFTSAPTITFENVSYRYPGAGTEAIQNITFEAPSGSITALVGRSGAGKSTLFSLLEQFYAQDSGSIRINSEDLRTIPEEIFRKNCSLVLQETGVWGETVWDNLTLGEELERSTVEEMLVELGLSGFVSRLPDGLNSDIGSIVTIASGGELQRLSIARAILRQPKILLLDEPTSHLDTENESYVQKLIQRMRGKTTTLVIAHRPTTIEGADFVIMLDRGKIASHGTHHELASDSFYRTLFSSLIAQ